MILAASFVSARVGYVLDGAGALWRTRNGGRTWTGLESLGTNRFLHFAFADARNGYVAVSTFARRDGGYVLRTSDGGVRWRPQLVGSEPVDAIETSGGTAYALAGSSSLSRQRTAATTARRARCRSRPPGGPWRSRPRHDLRPARPGQRRRARGRLDARRRPLDAVRRHGLGERDFATRWLVRKRAAFVAQVVGDAAHSGAGTPALTVVVKPKPKPKRR